MKQAITFGLLGCLFLARTGVAIDDFAWQCTNSAGQIHIKICGPAPAGAVSFGGGIDGNGYFQSGWTTEDQDIYCVEWTIPVTDFSPESVHYARLRFCNNFCANILGEVRVQFGPVRDGEDVQWYTSGTEYPGTDVQVLSCVPREEPAPENDPCHSGQAATSKPADGGDQPSEDGNQNIRNLDPVNLGTGATLF
jgi:hypothetical protein